MDVIFEKKNYFFTGDEVICKLGKIAKIGLFLVLATTESLFSNGNVQDTARANYFTQLANNYLNDLKYDSSLTYFRQAGEIWKIVGEKNKFLETQVGMSNILLRKGEKIKAFEILLNAEKIAREETYIHCSELGTIYTLLGYCYLSREEFDTAENYAKKGIDLNIKNFGEVHSKVASGYYTLGVVYKSKGEYDRAIDFLERAEKLQIVLYGKNYSSLANTYTSLGAVYDDKNEFARAIEYYKKALTILEITGRIYTADAGACYLYLMTSCGNKGDYHNAIEYGEKTIEIFTSLSLPEHLNVAGAYGKFGEIYTNLGDYEKAKEYLLRSLTIFTSKYPQNKSAAGMLYQHLGDVYKKTGDMENAIVYSEKGMKLFEQAYGEFHPQTGFMYEQLAGVYLEAKRFKDAIQYYNKAITARERVVNSHSRNDIASLYSSIGNVYLQQQLNDSALANLQKALMIESQSLEKNIPQRSLLQQRFGDLSYRQKQYSRALHYYQSAALALTQNNEPENVYLLPSFEKSIYKKELIEVVGNKARTFEMLYNQNHTINDLRAALSHYQKTMDLLDDARRQYSSDASKFYLSTISSSVYRNACRIALKLYEKTKDTQYNEVAFLIADRSKGNILLEKLFDGEAKQFAGIPDSLLNYERELLNNITQYETQLSREFEKTGADDSVYLSLLQTKHFTVKQQHQEFVELLERRYPKYFELKYARYSLSLKELQHRLEQNTTVIEYLIDDSVIYSFSVSKGSFSVQTLNNAQLINSLTQRFSTALKTYNAESYCSSGFELYSALLRPLQLEKTFSTATKIKIIPDGFLYYIPFEALPMKQYSGNTVDFTKLQYVVSRYDVSYSYSAAFDLKLREQEERSGSAISSFAGFAPVFRDSTKNGDFFANRSFVEESGLSDVRSITLNGKTFNELKYSEDEVVSIGNTFMNHTLSVKNFLHAAATEKNFKEFAPLYDVVHIATHGFINEKNPKLSAILFSQPKEVTNDDDGILYVDETFNLNLKAQLVVLSSCESGVGKLVDGEGMIALSRGLFYAGAKNIIFSLWKVSDKQTYSLMDEFYKNVVAGRSYSSALRTAKLSMIRSKESAFPSKWSGFVLIGK